MLEAPKKLLVPPAEAAAMLSLSRAGLYKFARSGRFPVQAITFGRKILYSTAELARYVEAGCPGREKWQQLKRNENKAGGK